MTVLKKILIFPIFFLFFLSCGYTPIFSKKDVNFNIENIKFLGDKDVKEKINHSLSNYRNKHSKEKKVSLIVNSSKKIILKNPFNLERGQEIGLFELGSTVICLFPPKQIELSYLEVGQSIFFGQSIGKLN